jgi:two-component system LytT family sensor kinase
MGINFAAMQRIKTYYFVEILTHALFWLVMYYAIQGLTVSSFQLIDRSPGGGSLRTNAHTLFPYAGVVLGFLMLLFYSSTFWLFKKIIRYKNNYARVVVITGWLLLVYSSNYLLVHMLIGTGTHQHASVQNSPQRIVTSFKARSDQHALARTPPIPPPPPDPPDSAALSEGWSQMQIIMSLAFLAILGIAAAYFFIKEWIGNELIRNKAETLQVDTELRFLRSQVSPHFLFNTLNNLFSMALKEGKGSLADKIAKLSNMMRYMLYESNTDNVSLEKEVGCLEDYLALHGMRYAGGEVDVSFLHPEPATVAAVQVAPMLFIPFLENAFKHGVAIGRQSSIALAISVSPQKLVFTCENTDHSTVKKLDEEKGGIGLENVKRRLELIYPGRYELHAGPQNGNYMVNLQIDLS